MFDAIWRGDATERVGHAIAMLAVAAMLGAALGVIREHIRKLTRQIRELGGQHGTTVEWEIKKYETVLP